MAQPITSDQPEIVRKQMNPRILIVDDHEIVRQGVRSVILKSRPEWIVCGEATNGKDAIQQAVDLHPDVVILDVSMPVMNGIEAATQISKVAPASRILIFTMHESERLVRDIRAVGACGYVQKSRAGLDLVYAIDRLLGGDTFFGNEANSSSDSGDAPKSGLSFLKSLCDL
jgi:DNA-binding NarL/FixJ family response regulator